MFGRSQEDLTIPASVTIVEDYALYDSQTSSLSLYILGNPDFKESSLEGVQGKIGLISFGSNMSINNMRNVILRVGKGNNLSRLEIDGYTGGAEIDWEDMGEYISSAVRVVMPAELVDEQIFGDAKVYGSFNLQHPLSTFCCKQSFYDDSDNANLLFYRADCLDTDSVDNKTKLHIIRVKVVVGGEGVLAHNNPNSSAQTELPRIWGNSSYSSLEEYTYSRNMLKGVLTPQTISPTDGPYTNMILYEGTFYPTTGGTLGANRAYLQVPTSDLENLSNLSLLFDNNM